MRALPRFFVRFLCGALPRSMLRVLAEFVVILLAMLISASSMARNALASPSSNSRAALAPVILIPYSWIILSPKSGHIKPAYMKAVSLYAMRPSRCSEFAFRLIIKKIQKT